MHTPATTQHNTEYTHHSIEATIEGVWYYIKHNQVSPPHRTIDGLVATTNTLGGWLQLEKGEGNERWGITVCVSPMVLKNSYGIFRSVVTHKKKQRELAHVHISVGAQWGISTRADSLPSNATAYIYPRLTPLLGHYTATCSTQQSQLPPGLPAPPIIGLELAVTAKSVTQ